MPFLTNRKTEKENALSKLKAGKRAKKWAPGRRGDISVFPLCTVVCFPLPRSRSRVLRYRPSSLLAYLGTTLARLMGSRSTGQASKVRVRSSREGLLYISLNLSFEKAVCSSPYTSLLPAPEPHNTHTTPRHPVPSLSVRGRPQPGNLRNHGRRFSALAAANAATGAARGSAPPRPSPAAQRPPERCLHRTAMNSPFSMQPRHSALGSRPIEVSSARIFFMVQPS